MRPFKLGERIVSAGDAAKFIMFVIEGYLMTTCTDDNGSDDIKLDFDIELIKQ